jgi:hypothetical protein
VERLRPQTLGKEACAERLRPQVACAERLRPEASENGQASRLYGARGRPQTVGQEACAKRLRPQVACAERLRPDQCIFCRGAPDDRPDDSNNARDVDLRRFEYTWGGLERKHRQMLCESLRHMPSLQHLDLSGSINMFPHDEEFLPNVVPTELQSSRGSFCQHCACEIADDTFADAQPLSVHRRGSHG